jgi:heme exporter protein D
MLPLAHVGHYFIWVLYAVPVLIVTVAIVRSMIVQRRWERDEEERA